MEAVKGTPDQVWYHLIHEHQDWAEEHFGRRADPIQPLLGIVEEIGELNLAFQMNDDPEIADSIADSMIFLIDFCRLAGVINLFAFLTKHAVQAPDCDEAFELRDVGIASAMEEHLGNLVIYAGQLAHFNLKKMQGIRYTEVQIVDGINSAVEDMVCVLSRLALIHDPMRPLWMLVDEVWQKVRARDWSKNPLGAADV